MNKAKLTTADGNQQSNFQESDTLQSDTLHSGKQLLDMQLSPQASHIRPEKLQIRFVTALEKIGKCDWQALFDSGQPFTDYDYLLSLEQSDCVGAEQGWQPYHLVIEHITNEGTVNDNFCQPKAEVVGLMPLYIKSHSYGEYMFDWSWAEAYQSHNLAYYPKLVNAIPYTPASGQRLALAKSLADNLELKSRVITLVKAALLEASSKLSLSNVQCLFNQAEDISLFNRCGDTDDSEIVDSSSKPQTKPKWLQREDVQFHWFNQGYQSFDDFLLSLTARKRKTIKKERQRVTQQGIVFRQLSGQQITKEVWQQFFTFYQLTYAKRSGHLGYLNFKCFWLWGQRLAERITLVAAYQKSSTGNEPENTASLADQQAEKMIAGALFFHDQSTLYGRYWGCDQEFDFLHFEACYYRGIELAIDRKLSCFNAGAQGEHKVARGFQPVITYGHYLLNDSPFSAAIEDFLVREKYHHCLYRQELEKKLPYKSESE